MRRKRHRGPPPRAQLQWLEDFLEAIVQGALRTAGHIIAMFWRRPRP